MHNGLRLLGLSAGLLSLVACTAVSTATSPLPVEPSLAPTYTNTLEPSQTFTPTEAPTDTPVPPTPTFTFTPTPAVIFRDDFEAGLADGWSWVRENQYYWSLTDAPGFLRLITYPGGLAASGGTPTNSILLREAPAGNFGVETLLQFTPTSNFQLAGLIIYQSDTSYLQFGRVYCDVGDSCVGNGIYFDNIENGNFSGGNFATSVNERSLAYLRLTWQGNVYTGYYSEDGNNWITIGQHESIVTPLQVGLVAHQASNGREAADFDYFLVTEISESTP